MGWSCTDAALKKFHKIMDAAKKGDSIEQTNMWAAPNGRYFYEFGEEIPDGSIVGDIMKETQPGKVCYLVGKFQISADGKVVAFPGMPKEFWNA